MEMSTLVPARRRKRKGVFAALAGALGDPPLLCECSPEHGIVCWSCEPDALDPAS